MGLGFRKTKSKSPMLINVVQAPMGSWHDEGAFDDMSLGSNSFFIATYEVVIFLKGCMRTRSGVLMWVRGTPRKRRLSFPWNGWHAPRRRGATPLVCTLQC